MRPLHIIVCVKPVPDPRYWNRLSLDPKTRLLRREGIPIIISPLDKHALEEALSIRDTWGGRVTVVSMGPPNTVEVLAAAYALGADETVLLCDRLFAGADTLATAYALSVGIRKIGGFDLILLGNESLDGGTGQVGPQVAELLGIPSVTNVGKIEFVGNERLHVKAKIQSGYMMIETRMPVALAVTRDINAPRITPVFGALWATEKQTKIWSAADIGAEKERIGLAGSPTYVPETTSIDVNRRGETLRGEPTEIARRLVQKLLDAGILSKS